MKILVTGVSGFVGTALIRLLCKDSSNSIYGLVRKTPKTYRNYHPIEIDFNKWQNIAVFSDHLRQIKPDWIIHLAGIRANNGKEIWNTNVGLISKICLALKSLKQKPSIIGIGTAAEYGFVNCSKNGIKESIECSPAGEYGLSKLVASKHILQFGKKNKVQCNILRPFNIIGRGVNTSMFMGAVMQRIRDVSNIKEPTITVGNLNSFRDYIDVEDVAQAILLCMQSNVNQEIINLCSGHALETRYVLEKIIEHSGVKNLKYTSKGNSQSGPDVDLIYGCCEKAQKLLGFTAKKALDKSITDAWNE